MVAVDCLDEWKLPVTLGLFPFQREIVEWALDRERCAIFADTGLGKALMQLKWAHATQRDTGGRVLILAPLAVARQTEREAVKFSIDGVAAVRHPDESDAPILVTNYERLHLFRDREWSALVLDESSILKSVDSKTRDDLTRWATDIRYRLCCTATPAPNDHTELGNHAEFLGVLTRAQMLGTYFVHDENSVAVQHWRLKGHAHEAFWRWVAGWAIAVRRPSDLGYEDDGYILPPLKLVHEWLGDGRTDDDRLFPVEARTLDERRTARLASTDDRVAATAAAIALEPDEPWIVWCDYNRESEALARAIPGAVEVRGPDSPESKEQALMDFAEGRTRVLVTKPSICGFGLNWQHCARVAFVGLSDSYEQWYQAIRRCWRFGQERPVEVFVFASEAERVVINNVQRKATEAEKMMEQIVRYLADARASRDPSTYHRDVAEGDGWTLHLGDSLEVLAESVEDNSVGLSVFSPPFPGMYVYSDSPRDLGNTYDLREFARGMRTLAGELLRVTMPGRSCAIHLCQTTAQKVRDGYVGIKDFRGSVIKTMERSGWVYYGEVAIDKDPQVKAIRTKDQGLLFKSLARDSAKMHMALADYVLQFRKPGDNPQPILAGVSERYGNPDGWITSEEWIEWAAPVWYRAGKDYPGGIRETDVLNVRQARDERDERHLAPLQLGVIERCVKLWSAPGDLVLSPFAGIGSEGVVALQHGRRFVGVELKPAYWKVAQRNLAASVSQMSLLTAAT
ncbi:MAG: DNA methyltransferase [Gemmatimonadaceae bacterium]|nr:DNA methyltransferase [Gemmatimonadaceae bacterium]